MQSAGGQPLNSIPDLTDLCVRTNMGGVTVTEAEKATTKLWRVSVANTPPEATFWSTSTSATAERTARTVRPATHSGDGAETLQHRADQRAEVPSV